MLSIQTEIQTQLFAHQDLGYRDFQAKLLPTIQKDTIIGVRTPMLRTLAKTFYKHSDVADFLSALPHTYYEENNLHGLLLAQIKEFAACLQATEQFLPYIDNWATCDLLSPPVFQSHTEQLLPAIQLWLQSPHCYTVRFGIGMLLRHYLDGHFQSVYLQWAAAVHSKEYYVNMMIAWYFATALAKQPTATLPFLENRQLAPWIHKKTIQKACESRRIPADQKAYLKTIL